MKKKRYTAQATDEAKKMAGLVKRLKKWREAIRAKGGIVEAEEALAKAVATRVRTSYHHWILTGYVPNVRVPLLDEFLTKGGY